MNINLANKNALLGKIAIISLFCIYSIVFSKRIIGNLDVGSGNHVDKLYNLRQPKSIGEQCLSLDLESSMDELLSKFRQVFVIMPAKNAGSSFKEFTKTCMVERDSWASLDNSLNKPENYTKMLQNSFVMPTLISSHVYNSKSFMELVKHATDDSLIIYIHRNGTDRLRSAIGHVSYFRECPKQTKQGLQHANGPCILKEGEVLDFIAARVNEIGVSETRVLTCDAYESIEANAPNLVFMNYVQVDKMFELLAKHHCPGQKAVHLNTLSMHDSERAVMVELESSTRNGDTSVDLQDWLDAKMDLIELGLQLKNDVSCQATTRKMQHDLFSCQDETIHVSSSDGSFLGFF